MTNESEMPTRRTILRAQLSFLAGSALLLIIVLTLLRLALLLYNRDQLADTTLVQLLEAFGNGLRFDGRLVAYLLLPLVPLLLRSQPPGFRRLQRLWLGIAMTLVLLAGLAEPVFYREFHQRLNGLVFQYIGEDPRTVLSMLWHGFPVARALLLWLVLSGSVAVALGHLSRWAQPAGKPARPPMSLRLAVLLPVLLVTIFAARGTLRHGPPLRWGDAYTTTSTFANQLGLNGTLCLYSAFVNRQAHQDARLWKSSLPPDKRDALVRERLLGRHETLVDSDQAPVRRIDQPLSAGVLPIHNVVVILMESFAGRYIGALGDPHHVTPCFDRLAENGLLFTHFFSNGTHTHQGLFATMASFPNLPGYEYLMQMPEGGHAFSGLTSLLKQRDYNDLYVYNGDFAWDNQAGFFTNQGMSRFIGRDDYRNPVVSDPTWGVSDQDMFDRAAQELASLPQDKPFFALLQTLTNHTPYAMPAKLPVAAVTDCGGANEHLTAMRYADWALGRFFDAIKQMPFYRDTLFVLVGDHAFGNAERLTEMDLNRFHIPLLLIAPGIQERFGHTRDTVGSQVDVVPTILGRLGQPFQHQCWGRDLLDLPDSDPGFAVIKPSGSDQTMALIEGTSIYIRPKNRASQLACFDLQHRTAQQREEDDSPMAQRLQAYVESAVDALKKNRTGF
ncbi:MAG: LTA synthase family protein [Desulfuromonadaceae bacterium]|nr:LTA synthase family protein [Desulfuromonadaceae bacterium]